MKTIKLMADYECHPLWHVSPDEFGDIDPESLPMSTELQAGLKAWAQDYDATLNMDAPQDSGFESEEQERRFKAQGHRLADQLRAELGSDFVVTTQI